MAVAVSEYDTASIWGPIVVAVSLFLANVLAWALNERSWPFRHLFGKLRCPRFLFVSQRKESVSSQARPTTYWTFDLLDASHVVTSPVLSTSGLLVLHACTFLYWVATVIVDVVIEYYGHGCTASWCYRRQGPYLEWMTYLTNWSISILGLAGLVAFINTARYMKQQRRAQKPRGEQCSGRTQQPLPRQQVQLGTLTAPAAAALESASDGDAAVCRDTSRPPATVGGWLPTSTAAGGSLSAYKHADGFVRMHEPSASLPGADAAPPESTAGQQMHQQLGPVAGLVQHKQDLQQQQQGVAAPQQQQQQQHQQTAWRWQPQQHECTAGQQPWQEQQQQRAKAQQQPHQEHQQQGCVSARAAHEGAGDCSGASSGSSSCTTVVLVDGAGGQDPGKLWCWQWDWLGKTHCILMQVATITAFFVSFWYWVGLVAIAGEFFRANGGTLMAHAGNFVIALLQLLLTRLPVVSTHFQVLLWYASLYEVFLWSYGSGSGTWRYGLDWQKAKPAGVLILLPLVVFIFFGFWFGVARLREVVLHKRNKRAILPQQHTQPVETAAASSAASVVRQP